ncbi:serine hydrolase domain-containing protein [Pedobacter sp.]|uniref:serine hydrolase domain-containing protein n=1 Tax=Pedobacter sp. TaxID=1411316 RepID=UPI0031D98540
MKKLLIFWLFLSASLNSFGQRSDHLMNSKLDSAVDKLMEKYMKSGKRVAVSVGISYNGRKAIYNYGEIYPGAAILPTEKSNYEIGSITKTFTGLLVAHAINEGKISLNDDVRKFLPANLNSLQYPNGQSVKIAYLLAHTARFPNSFNHTLTGGTQKENFLKFLKETKLDSLKSFKYEYSNVGYQLLGLILERVYQKSYDELIEKYITGPLGMKHTKTIYNANEKPLLLQGYDKEGKEANPTVADLPAAGGLRSTVQDMLKYLDYQSKESDAAVKLTHRIIVGDVDKEAYGFQWAIGKTWNWNLYLRIDGGTNGFRSFCVMYPMDQINIVLLSNQKDETAGLELYKVATGIYTAIKPLSKRR